MLSKDCLVVVWLKNSTLNTKHSLTRIYPFGHSESLINETECIWTVPQSVGSIRISPCPESRASQVILQRSVYFWIHPPIGIARWYKRTTQLNFYAGLQYWSSVNSVGQCWVQIQFNLFIFLGSRFFFHGLLKTWLSDCPCPHQLFLLPVGGDVLHVFL